MRKKRLLFLAHRIPFPPNKGDKIRTFNQVKYLSRDFSIDLVTLADDPGDLKHQADLAPYCRSVHVYGLNSPVSKIRGLVSLAKGRSITQAYFSTPGFRRQIRELLSTTPYDAVLCFSSSMGEPVLAFLNRLGEGRKPPRLVMDFCDVDSEKWRQYAAVSRFPMNGVYGLESSRLRQFEQEINQAFHASVFVSSQEADLFRHVLPAAVNVHTVGNGVDFDYFSPETGAAAQKGPGRLMFAGAMDYHANVEGVAWFCQEILPRVADEIPDIRFDIVGANPTPTVQALAKEDRITVTGFVADIRPWYNRADVVVVPLRIARGIQNKVLEAMAMAKPVVACASAVEGIGAEPGVHVRSADESDAFAKEIIGLLRDREAASALGRTAREFVMDSFSWETAMAGLARILTP